MKKTIGLTYNLKSDMTPKPGDPPDINAEFDQPNTVEGIMQALKSAGHEVKPIGNVNQLLQKIDHLDVDMVFNIAEGFNGRNRESQVPILLELKGIPYLGADALTLGITLDKVLAKKCFIADKIPTPRFFEAFGTDDLEKLNTIGYPLFVKPRFEGTSKGLSENSRVENLAGLKRQVELINKAYKQPALVEEFIKGSEFTVGVLGNEHPEALPVVQIKIEGKADLGNMFYTFTRVTVDKDKVEYVCPAQISPALASKMQEYAVAAYKSVDCRDFGRVDFRVDEKGSPYVLEINPLPSLSEEDAFNFIAQALGISFNEMINRILNVGLERHGLLNGKYKEATR